MGACLRVSENIVEASSGVIIVVRRKGELKSRQKRQSADILIPHIRE
jgi:hypothetical protein